MFKKLFISTLCLISTTVFGACDDNSVAFYGNANFCSTFKPVASCHCNEDPRVPAFMKSSVCSNMNYIYELMKSTYGSIEDACKNQGFTDSAICANDWKCYHDGGSVNGVACSGNTNKCQ